MKRDEEQQRETVESEASGLEVAIIGMAGRFPGANNIEAFWDNLKNGVESIGFYSEGELVEAGVEPGQMNNPAYVKVVGKMERADYFDASFFGYTPREARLMPPQARIFHCCAWEALEDAGITPDTYDGRIGLYAGASSSTHWEVLTFLEGAGAENDEFTRSILANKDNIATHIAFQLNLKGPAVVVQTACSTSLVAIHLAVQGLLNGESEVALAGGVTVSSNTKGGYFYQEGMIMSKDGHVRAFDANANGVVGGNGAAVVVLKALEDAVTHHDHIYAVIKGSAINNDGTRKVGYTAPSVNGQAEVIKAAQYLAGVAPETIGYIEAHGTATALGDPVEIEALTQAFKTSKRNFCAIGSVKTNVGHLDNAAGAAGLIKAALALYHKFLPPSLHFETPNPHIDFKNSPFFVVTTPTVWKPHDPRYPLRAGVSSFGIGGTNAHVVLEQAPVIGHSSLVIGEKRKEREYQLILLSAKTKTALDKMTENLAEYFKRNLLNRGNHENPTNPGPTLADVAYTLQKGRKTFPYKRMLVCSSNSGIETAAALLDPSASAVHTYIPSPGEENRDIPVVFMFPGQGSQYVDMGRDLYEYEPFFRSEMDRCFEILKPLVNYDIKEILYPSSGINRSKMSDSSYISDINQTEIAQPVVFAFEYALAKLLIKWGTIPQAMIGHSIGEYTTACVSGVFSLEDALKLVVLRGRLMQQMPPGAMLGVRMTKEDLIPLLNDELSLAAVNTPSFCVVSGPTEIIHAFADQLKEKGYSSRLLHTSHAFHSKMMEPILEKFEAQVGKVAVNKPGIPYISNVTGNRITFEEVANPQYWANHTRKTVQFSQGLKELLEKSHVIFVEVGPGNVLSTFVRQHPGKKENHFIINLTRHPKENVSDRYYLLNKIGELWLYGIKINWDTFHAAKKRNSGRIPLPAYPFEPQRCSIEGGIRDLLIQKFPAPQSPANALAVKKNDMADWFYVPSWKRSILQNSMQNNTNENSDNSNNYHHRSAHWQAVRYNWLVFIDSECGIGLLFVKGLRQQGHNVITVKAGKLFAKPVPGDDAYTLNPDQPSDYHALLHDLSQLKKRPNRIVHFWSLTREPSRKLTLEEFKKTQKFGFYSIINLVQAMDRQEISGWFQLDVVTNHTQEVVGGEPLSPQKATMLGTIKVIPQEYPNIRCRCLDIFLPSPGSLQEETLVRQLQEECSGKSLDSIVAYRSNFRWVQTFEPIRLTSNQHHARRKHESLAGHTLREGGVYLVTGGLGNVGLILAEYLAVTAKARLILTGRSPFPPAGEWQQWLSRHDQEEPLSRKIRKLQKLRQMGAEVLVIQADAGNQEKMKEVIQRAEEKFGPINGVIHAAGITQGRSSRTAAEIKWSECEQQFHVKAYSLLVLEKLFRHKTLDFCFLMSSLSAVLGGLGFVAYAAANHFMDLFVQWYNRNSRTRWISVDWDGWQSDDTVKTVPAAAETLVRLQMTPGEGQQAFQRILSSNKSNLYVQSAADLQSRIDQWIKLEALQEETISQEDEKTGLYARPRLLTPYVPPSTECQQVLAGIWRKLFGFDKIGIQDDFFELGGDSLKAITLTGMLHKAFNTKITLVDFFNRPTVKQLAEYINRAEKSTHSSIKPAEDKEYYMLSSTQKRLYFLNQLDLESTAYNISEVISLQGELELKKLEEIFKKLIQRHGSLRTSFYMVADEPVQRVHKEVKFNIESTRLAKKQTGEEDKDETAVQASTRIKIDLINNFIRPFDLSRAPLLRVNLLQVRSHKNYLLLVDMHHIISDGVSHHILAGDFMTLLKEQKLPPLRLQYNDYSQWQNSPQHKKTIQEQEEYWQRQFCDKVPVLNLPLDFPRPKVQSFEGGVLSFELSGELSQSFNRMAFDNGATLYMVLMAIYSVLLSKLSGDEDIVVGTPIACRRHVDLERIFGMFVNTLALRNFPLGEKPFRLYLKEVKELTLAVFENQEYPFADLVEKVAPRRDTGRNPIFDVMLNLLNQDGYTGQIPVTDDQEGYEDEYRHRSATSKFDLNLTAQDMGTRQAFTLEYSTALFKPATIERFITYFRNILYVLSHNPAIKLAEIEIITPKEKEQILQMTIGTTEEYDETQTIHQLFQQQTVRTPQQVAAVYQDRNLTYEELDHRTRRLARLLREKGVRSDIIVGLMVERSLEMVIGLLGILQAGGAYLPIDIEYPRARKAYMLQDSSVRLVLNNFQPEKPDDTIPVKEDIESININDNDLFYIPQEQREGKSQFLENISRSSDLIYVIYTSGSTGKPKGVMLEHRNLVNLMHYQLKYANMEHSKILQFATISFDASFHEIFSALLSGGTLYLIDKDLRANIPDLFQHIARHQIKTLFMPMSFLKLVFSEEDYIKLIPKSIAHIQTAGEQVVVGHRFRDYLKSGSVHLHNHYGPSETHVVTALTLHPKGEIPKLPPIGKPVLNTSIYILDRSMHLVPIDVPGELYISGLQVGRGYLDRPELTAEKFIYKALRLGTDFKGNGAESNRFPMPWDPCTPRKSFLLGEEPKDHLQACSFSSIQSCSLAVMQPSPIYRTGDLAKYMQDGNIRFLGRIDHQVKIRGFRVEMGEIENRLDNHPGIKESVAIMRQDEKGEKYLCAYIVPLKELEISGIREYLAQQLPAYMIPTYFVQLDEIPLTPNRKIDRAALPAPGLEISPEDEAPGNQIEEKMVELWSEVLGAGKDKIGIHRNFFQIGGHSLKATVLISKIHRAFDVKVPLAEVFKTPTVKGLAQYIRESVKDRYASIQPVEKKEYYPLSPAQKRLYILQQLELEGTAYNMPYFIPLAGNIDIKTVAETFKKLLARHESLRTSFLMIHEQPVQKVHDEVKFTIQSHRCDTTPGKETTDTDIEHDKIREDFVKPFDLTRAPLVGVEVIEGENKFSPGILFLDMHHIITDGVSQRILEKEFQELYAGENLTPLRLQYKDFSDWQNREGQQKLIKHQEQYWTSLYSDELPVLNLPADFPRPLMQRFEGNTMNFILSQQQTRILKELSNQSQTTLYISLLAIYTILLYKLSSQEDIIIGTTVAARRHADLEPIIGMFVNTLILRNYPLGEKTLEQYLKEIKECTLRAFENQEYPFENLVEKVTKSRDTSRNPIFDVMLNFLDQTSYTGDIPGVNRQEQNDTAEYVHRKSTSKFDLTLTVVDMETRLFLSFEYATALYKPTTIERYAAYFKRVIDSIAKKTGIKLREIDVISNQEKKQLLYHLDNTNSNYPNTKTPRDLFEKQVEQTPDNTALIGQSPNTPRETILITYRQLNRESHRLAGKLKEKGVKPDTIVAVMAEPSLEMIVGILAILKAGGAYLPLDPDYPRERIKYMLKDSNAKVVLAGPPTRAKVKAEVEANIGLLRELSLQLVNIETEFASSLQPSPCPLTLTSTCQASPTNLAYIIYTSGTTGKPKGTLIDNRNIVRLLFNDRFQFDFNGQDVWPLFHSYCFDFSVWEMYGALLYGGRLVLIPQIIARNPYGFREKLIKENVTVLNQTPAAFYNLARVEMEIPGKDLTLKYVILGGEALAPVKLKEWKEKYPGTKLVNMYGITETTVHVTYKEIENRDTRLNISNIGKPISTLSAYIMDKHQNLVPPGAVGELYVGGQGVGRGYLNRPELTAEKFNRDLWDYLDYRDEKAPGKKDYMSHKSYIYKSGDLVRLLENGEMEYLGRIDHQVKIRGYRIELGEIESRLLRHDKIKKAVVTAEKEKTGTGVGFLSAYIVLEDKDITFAASELREYLLKELPEYMVPSYFFQIDFLPLTPNGKVDRKALDLHGTRLTLGTTYAAPQNDIEKKIVNVWKEILQTDKIGIHDNYFELGGNSLDIIRINKRLKEIFQMDISIVTMFRYTTVYSFANYLIHEAKEILDRGAALKRGKKGKIQRLRKKKGTRNG